MVSPVSKKTVPPPAAQASSSTGQTAIRCSPVRMNNPRKIAARMRSAATSTRDGSSRSAKTPAGIPATR